MPGLKFRKWILGALVLALIAYFAIPHFPHDPRLSSGIRQMQEIISKSEKYRQENGTYPTTLKDIGVDVGSDNLVSSKIHYDGAIRAIEYKDWVEMDYSPDPSLKKIGYKIYIPYSGGRLLYQKNPYRDKFVFEGWYSFDINYVGQPLP